MSSTQPRLRVAICGAGIGGLLLAVVIGKFSSDIALDIYEAHDAVATAGAGISFRQRTLNIAKQLGIYDEIAAVVTFPLDSERTAPGFVSRISDIKEGGFEWFSESSSHQGIGRASMHRMDFVRVIQAHLPEYCEIHLSKRLRTYNESDNGEITMHFEDGTSVTADVLVGADGLRSHTRRTMFETAAKVEPPLFDVSQLSKYTDARWSGFSMNRELIPMEKVLARYPDHPAKTAMCMMAGKRRAVVVYGIKGGAVLNLVANTFDPELEDTPYPGERWVGDTSKEDVLDKFSHFEPLARSLVELCEKPSRWAVHVVGPLPFWTRGHVVILGDAAHATTPHLGAGAGQAIDDAWLLGRLLAHPHIATPADVPRALKIFEEICKPYAERLAEASVHNGKLFNFCAPGDDPLAGPDCESERSPEALRLRWEKGEANRIAIDEIEDPIQQWERAEEMLVQA
ncbi:FAD/NAD(P)-binding domain-containing protein [Coniophora puteana RWD-64-598 SS2]|uniref:FAD/NAD(P)-binding domain-containing protein n=1 Tax=Coniophora puteana (strain RWD-64-598) TaxID=741705 RepID=A0A5M3MQZ8_CONPW|nr:FAD/NAD(P)-binding domain-containing protein [Coniophora puteana RWD-64-598 SS2]EIW81164.1 FAD/NAD(P)-binding domain-containing protein [Coniophora puteana RWD-64-598 SS2]